MSSTWSQLEQLLTCCICLDRYRNPRLLPCQHSFCSEPCLDGLVDYARRQIKCPECRAEHRLPYSGEPNFPANFTLMRFLELYQRVTGEEPEPLPSALERCAVCSERAELRSCAHCEKRICGECRGAHASILRRELQRLNAQIRRALARLQEELGQLSKCEGKLHTGCESARTQLDSLADALIGAVQEKRSALRQELDEFENGEQGSLAKMREIIGEELDTLRSNCELIELHMLADGKEGIKSPGKELTDLEVEPAESVSDWTDTELIECRDIYLRTLEFLRHFETVDSLEYARKALKLELHAEIDSLRKNVANFAILRIQLVASDCLHAQIIASDVTSQGVVGTGNQNMPVPQPFLMRSQSDHRLAAQFAKKEAAAAAGTALQGSVGPGGSGAAGVQSGGRYPYGYEGNEYGQPHYQSGGAQFAFKSRFMREKNAEMGLYDEDTSEHGGRAVRFDDQTITTPCAPASVRLFEGKQAPKAPLSHIVKLSESLHLAERLDEQRRKLAKAASDAKNAENSQVTINQQPNTNQIINRQIAAPISTTISQTPAQISAQQVQPQQQPLSRTRLASRQVSEDEIEKQKKINKQLEQQQQATLLQHASTPAVATVTQVPTRQPPSSQTPVNILPTSNPGASISPMAALSGRSPQTQRNDDVEDEEDEEEDEEDNDDDEEDEQAADRRQVPTSEPQQGSQQSSAFKTTPNDSNGPLSNFEALSDTNMEQHSRVDGIQNRTYDQTYPVANGSITAGLSSSRGGSIEREPYSTFGTAKLSRQNSNSSSSGQPAPPNGGSPIYLTPRNSVDHSASGSIVNSRSNSFDRDASPGSYRYLTRANTRLDDLLSRDYSDTSGGGTSSSNHNRFNRLNRLARSSTVSSLSPSYTNTQTGANSSSAYTYTSPRTYEPYLSTSGASSGTGTSGSGYLSMRSRPSSPPPPVRSTGTSSYRSGGTGSSSSTPGSGLSRYSIGNSSVGTSSYRRSSGYTPDTKVSDDRRYQYRTRVPRLRSPSTEQLFPNASSWSSLDDLSTPSVSIPKQGRESESLSTVDTFNIKKESLASPSRSLDTSQTTGRRERFAKKTTGSLSTSRSPAPSTTSESEVEVEEADSLALVQLQHRRQMYTCKERLRLQFGKRGEAPGEFCWPRDVAVLQSRHAAVPHRIAVADTSNRRCQIFDAYGNFLLQFNGGFEELATLVATTGENGQERIILSDRATSRVHVFDFQGNLLRVFGNCGPSIGQLRSPAGLAWEPVENAIYVCDQGNKRVQVFGVEGNFQKLFAAANAEEASAEQQRQSTIGSKRRMVPIVCAPQFACIRGDLLLISDPGQHVVILFKWTSGRRLLTLGGEGSAPNRFKFPRGVALDANGFIIVADAGNNRVQLFNPDGTFLKAFGRWGSGEGEFKGLEGLAVTENGEICVCDRENHRVQVF